jgi:insulysin
LNYLSHLLGHEGPNSLLSYLISEGLALELSSSGDHELWSFDTFSVDITLTQKGMGEVDRVVEAVFQYAKMIRDKGV